MERGRLSRRRAATAADWSATRSGPLKLSNMHPAAKNEIVHPAGEINRNMGVDGPKRCINFFIGANILGSDPILMYPTECPL